MKATLKQGRKIIEIFEDLPDERLQAILGSGLLADIRDADMPKVKRDDVRRVLGLEPLFPPPAVWPSRARPAARRDR